jgi:transposase
MDGLQDLPDEVRQYILYLEKKIQELEQRLKLYENPHTPSSQQRFKNNSRNKNPTGRRGAPPGHHGATRPTPTPDKIIPVTMHECPRCGSYLGAATTVESRTIEDLPPPQKTQIIRYDLHHYHCPNCGAHVKATHPECPQVGTMGIRLMTRITTKKFPQREPLRMIQDSLLEEHACALSPAGIHNVLLRVGDACAPEYERLLHRVRTAHWRHADETSAPVRGTNHWLWAFRTNHNDVLITIQPSRGRKVLDEILGADFTGAMVTDGYRSYQKLPEVQRCWAHLLREVDNGDLTEHEQQFSENIHRRFEALKTFIGKDPPMTQRQRQKRCWDKELTALAEEYLLIPETRTKAQYLKNGLGSWHTCLLHPGMQPTNNLAEQAIREHVIQRKIIGCFRSTRGPENYARIASVLATWRLQGKNVTEELENLLRRELCFSKS